MWLPPHTNVLRTLDGHHRNAFIVEKNTSIEAPQPFFKVAEKPEAAQQALPVTPASDLAIGGFVAAVLADGEAGGKPVNGGTNAA